MCGGEHLCQKQRPNQHLSDEIRQRPPSLQHLPWAATEPHCLLQCFVSKMPLARNRKSTRTTWKPRTQKGSRQKLTHPRHVGPSLPWQAQKTTRSLERTTHSRCLQWRAIKETDGLFSCLQGYTSPGTVSHALVLDCFATPRSKPVQRLCW